MNKRQFWAYYNCADEIFEATYNDNPTGNLGITLEDLSKEVIAEARQAATDHGFPWPPHLPTAEEFVLNNNEALRS